jgi:hypothetical protein
MIDVLDGGETTALGVGAESVKLDLRVLVLGAHTGVEGEHGYAPAS